MITLPPVLEASRLRRTFGVGDTATTALADVSLHLGRGEFIVLMGPSGSGKSTLFALLSGLLRPSEGTVHILGTDLWDLSERARERFRQRHFGFIFQGFNLFPALTATQQVMTVLKYQGVAKDEARRRAVAALEEVGLGARLNQKPDSLSGGEKQRIAIARALAKNPALLFADEPTSALDGENGQTVIRLLRRAAERNRFAERVNKALDDNPLPPFDTLKSFLAPAGAVLIDEATGIHYIAFGLKAPE